MTTAGIEHLRHLYDEQLAVLTEDCITRCENRRGLRERSGDLLESAFLDLAERLRPDVSVEIGAHEASFSARLKARLPNVHALAFEANPYVYEHFAPALRAPEIGVDYRFAAVCDRDGFAELRIPKTLIGDVLERRNVISSLRYWAGDVAYENVTVPSLRVDTALAAMPGARSVAWIDAEGAQSEIFAGGSAYFARVDAVYIEVEDTERWRGQSLYDEVAERLAGFSLVPAMRDNLARGQFNEIFVRTEAGVAGAAVSSAASYLDALRGLASVVG